MRSKSFRLIGVLCVAMAVVLCINSAPMSFTLNAGAETISQMKDKLSELQDEAKELEDKIADLRKDKKDAEALKNALQDRVNNTQNRIDLCNGKLSEIDGRITALNLKISAAETNIADIKDQYKKRLRAIYMSGGSAVNSIIMLLDSGSFSDLLAKSELTSTISQKDQKLIEELMAYMAEIQADKEEVQKERAAQAEVRAELSSLRKDLNTQLYEAEEVVKGINRDENNAENELDRIERAIEEYEQSIKDALKEAESNNSDMSFNSGIFKWPAPGFFRISSPFGYRYHPITGQWKLHGGTDIAGSGISNSPAVAAADGVVTIADYNSSYGYYVMIYHGEGSDGHTYATLYAHLWSHCVREGQMVTAGQKVGNIGSTGSSTGPHLHFEIRTDGTRVDPMNYFK